MCRYTQTCFQRMILLAHPFFEIRCAVAQRRPATGKSAGLICFDGRRREGTNSEESEDASFQCRSLGFDQGNLLPRFSHTCHALSPSKTACIHRDINRSMEAWWVLPHWYSSPQKKTKHPDSCQHVSDPLCKIEASS